MARKNKEIDPGTPIDEVMNRGGNKIGRRHLIAAGVLVLGGVGLGVGLSRDSVIETLKEEPKATPAAEVVPSAPPFKFVEVAKDDRDTYLQMRTELASRRAVVIDYVFGATRLTEKNVDYLNDMNLGLGKKAELYRQIGSESFLSRIDETDKVTPHLLDCISIALLGQETKEKRMISGISHTDYGQIYTGCESSELKKMFEEAMTDWLGEFKQRTEGGKRRVLITGGIFTGNPGEQQHYMKTVRTVANSLSASGLRPKISEPLLTAFDLPDSDTTSYAFKTTDTAIHTAENEIIVAGPANSRRSGELFEIEELDARARNWRK